MDLKELGENCGPNRSHDSFDPELIKKLPRYPIPCIVVGRFAVDQNHQGHGIGKRLLARALKQILKVSEIVWVNFVVIHAKDTKAMDFYTLRIHFIKLKSTHINISSKCDTQLVKYKNMRLKASFLKQNHVLQT